MAQQDWGYKNWAAGPPRPGNSERAVLSREVNPINALIIENWGEGTFGVYLNGNSGGMGIGI